MDRVSRRVRDALGVPDASAIAPDLPLADTFGESEAAFKAYVEALNTRLFDNDLAASDAAFDRALEADPDFVLA